MAQRTCHPGLAGCSHVRSSACCSARVRYNSRRPVVAAGGDGGDVASDDGVGDGDEPNCTPPPANSADINVFPWACLDKYYCTFSVACY